MWRRIRNTSVRVPSCEATCSSDLQGLKPVSFPPLTSGLKPRPPKPNFRGQTWKPSPRERLLFFSWSQLDPEQIELIRVHCRWRVSHQILRLRRLREGDYFADRLFTREQRRDAVKAQSDATVRRRPIRQRIEKEAEAIAPLLLAEAQHLEHAVLQLLLVNSNAARAEFNAVQHEVIAFRTHGQAHFVGRVLELGNILLHDAREGMLRADYRFFRRAPFKKREARNPQKLPAVFRD